MIGFKKLPLKMLMFLAVSIAAVTAHALDTPSHPVKFRVVAIAESGNTPHNEFVAAAKVWLQQLADENDFAIDYITNTDPINDAFLAKYKLFIQLNYPPYRWTPVAKKLSNATSRAAPAAGSAFTMPCCWVILTDTRCGHGGRTSWGISGTPATSRSSLRRR